MVNVIKIINLSIASPAPLCVNKKTETVCSFSFVNTRYGHKNEFQELLIEKIETVIIIGTLSGRITVKNIVKLLAPSIFAAST